MGPARPSPAPVRDPVASRPWPRARRRQLPRPRRRLLHRFLAPARARLSRRPVESRAARDLPAGRASGQRRAARSSPAGDRRFPPSMERVRLTDFPLLAPEPPPPSPRVALQQLPAVYLLDADEDLGRLVSPAR